MKPLHICSIDNDIASGVSVVVPQYARNQAEQTDVILYNVNQNSYDEKEKFLIYNRESTIDDILKDNQIDIAIFHGIYFPSYLTIYKKLLKKKIPYIIVPHGSLRSEAQSQKKIPKMILNAMFFKQFINSASSIQYLSDTEKLASSEFKVNSYVCPNGVSMRKERWKKKERNGLKLVYIGRYAMYFKGLDILLEACKLIKDDMEKNNIIIELYGTDFENNKKILLEYRKEYGLENVVQINGPVYNEDKIDVMLDADAFIQTSRSEGQPLGVLEAMAIGLVPIVTKGTTFMEVVEEKKCGFSAGENKEDIAKAILTVYEKKEQLSQMSQKVIKVVEEYFEWKSVTKNLLMKYEQLQCNKYKKR